MPELYGYKTLIALVRGGLTPETYAQNKDAFDLLASEIDAEGKATYYAKHPEETDNANHSHA